MVYILGIWLLGLGLFRLIDIMTKQGFYLKQYLIWSILIAVLLIAAAYVQS